MCQNHGVAYIKPGVVEVREIEYPKLAPGDRKCEHGVILKIVSTNICGSDQHMVRGRTTAPEGLSIRIGLGWAKSHSIHTGQCPVMKYHRQLMNAILYDKIKIADAVNVQVISLQDSVKGYDDFDKGAAKKFVIDPHGMIPN